MAVVQGERRFAAPPERVFALLTDPDVIASAMPAMRGHTVIDADHWEAKVKPPLPLAPSIRIRFEVQERRPPEHAAMHAHGGGADVLPLTYFTKLTRDVMVLHHHVWAARGAIAVVLVWGVIGLVAAIRGFRWQPREA